MKAVFAKMGSLLLYRFAQLFIRDSIGYEVYEIVNTVASDLLKVSVR